MLNRQNLSMSLMRIYSIEPSVRFDAEANAVHLKQDTYHLSTNHKVEFGQILSTKDQIRYVVIGACDQHLWFLDTKINLLVNRSSIPNYKPIFLKELADPQTLRDFFYSSSNFPELVEELNINKYRFTFGLTVDAGDKVLGKGHSATVYKKRFHDLDIAYKVVNRKNKRGYSRELRMMSWMQDVIPKHDNILQFHGFTVGTDEERLYLEYGGSITIGTFIDSNKRYKLENCLSYILQVARGLEILDIHEVVHCDIKPDNLTLNSNGVVKICDFGLARQSNEFENVSVVCGTGDYIAPEIAPYFAKVDPKGERNKRENNPLKNSNHQTDMYAFGLVIYQLLARENILPDWLKATEYAAYVQNPANQPQPNVTAAHSLPERKMASLYKWCCMFNPAGRPTASQIVAECEFGEQISNNLATYSPF